MRIKTRPRTRRRSQFVLLACSAMLIGAGQQAADATHTVTNVTAVEGSAYGYFLRVSLFGSPPFVRGPAPTVTLAADGSNSPQTATASSGVASVPPATFFTSGQLDVSTQGTTGPTGSVTTTANIADIATANGGALGATNVASSCTSSATGTTGTTTITGGVLETDSGDDINGDGDFTDPGEHANVTQPVPTSPTANSAPIDGHIHVNGAVDSFTYQFNEQIVNPDGSLTVYAAHQILIGPTAVGDLFLGKSECGVTVTTAPGSNTAPVAVDDAFSTEYQTALTIAAPGVLTSDTDADGGTLVASGASDPAGGSVTLAADGSFSYTPDAGFSGADTFTYTVTDDHGASDTGLVTIAVGSAPPPPPPTAADLSVTLADSVDTAGVRTQYDYTVSVTNNGPDAATGVVALTTLTGAKFVSASGSGVTCVVVKGKNRGIRCDFGDIASGATATVTLTVAAGNKAGTATASSTVSSTSNDPVPGNNTATESTTVLRP